MLPQAGSKDPDTVIITFGHNDLDGHIAKMSLSATLASLVPIFYEKNEIF